MGLHIDETLLRRVLAELSDFILVIDTDRTIRFVNRMEPGNDPAAVVGVRSTDVIFPESRELLDAAMDRVFEAREAASFEVRARHADGSDAWYGGQITPLFDGHEVIGAVVRAQNITPLRAVQEELTQLRKLLSMCAWCGRIQTEPGRWEGLATYLSRVGDTDVSHGICPECREKQFGTGL